MSYDRIKDSAVALILALILFFLCLAVYSGLTMVTKFYGA